MFETTIGAFPGARAEGEFWFGGRWGRGVRQYADLRKGAEILRRGTWAVVAEFDGPWHAWELAQVRECDDKYTPVIPVTTALDRWPVPPPHRWHSSLTQAQFTSRVRRIHALIASGRISQVNLCRILSTPAPDPPPARAVYRRVADRHSAPHGGWFDFPADVGPETWIVAASPELAVRVQSGALHSAPIKGTAPRAEDLLRKDYEENRLVSEALIERIRPACTSAAVSATAVEEHPGLVQLVTTTRGTLRRNPATFPGEWASLLELLLPPLSVAGVPIQPALAAIADLEPVARGPYCGAIGWIDADAGEACLGAMIRSFWWDGGKLKFGTGAGITAASDPRGEWEETELKAGRLLSIIAGIDARPGEDGVQ